MLKNLKWFTVENRFIYFTCIMRYKCLNNFASNYLVNLFKYVSDTHSYVTRDVTDDYLASPAVSTSLYKRSLSYNGVTLWNSLPSEM